MIDTSYGGSPGCKQSNLEKVRNEPTRGGNRGKKV